VRIAALSRALLKIRNDSLGGEKSAAHVDIKHQIKSFGWSRKCWSEINGARVINKNVYSPEFGGSFFDRLTNLIFIP